jgi:hypothetical protein
MTTSSKVTGAALAAVAAALFRTAAIVTAVAAEEAKVHCAGVNACKGSGACSGTDSPPPSAGEPTDVSWIVWRKTLGVLYRRLDPDEAVALDRAAAAASFAELCLGLSAHVPETETPGRAAGLLRRWMEDCLIIGLREEAADLISDGESWRETAAPAPSAPG